MCGVLASSHLNHENIRRLASMSVFERRPKAYAPKSASETRIKLKRLFGDAPSCCALNRFCESLYWTCRRIQLWLCFYNDEVEIDVEDLLSNPFNTQPPSLNELAHITGFNKEWIMFVYRNFKQICSNGRMPLHQWRRIFRLIFPNSADAEFADRVFYVIAGDKTKKLITFEDLILCLHGISKCCCTEGSSARTPRAMAMAQFVFSLMEPNDKRQVNIDAFEEYAGAVFNLNAPCMAPSSHGFFGQMHVSNDTPGIPTPFHCSPAIRNYAMQRFNDLDTDNDGFITVEDVERTLLGTDSCSVRLSKEAHLQHA